MLHCGTFHFSISVVILYYVEIKNKIQTFKSLVSKPANGDRKDLRVSKYKDNVLQLSPVFR